MNLFEYTAKSAYLDSLKYVHELESELRSLQPKIFTDNWSNRYTKTPFNLDELVRPFMLYTKCLKLFEEKSSRNPPDFIYYTKDSGATHIVERLNSCNQTITYEQYLDIFQFMNDKPIVLSHQILGISNTNTELEMLIEIIGTNENPYNFNYSRVRSNNFYSSLSNDIRGCSVLLQAISLRQLKFNDKKYTVLEDFINFNYSNLASSAKDWKGLSSSFVKVAQEGLNAAIELQTITSKDTTCTNQ